MAENQPIETAQKTAVVTGVSSGIGREIAVQLADLGWEVIAIARSEDKLKELAAQYPAITPRPADLTQLTDGAFAELIPERVDALVHAAGISPDSTAEEASPEEWLQVFTLNVFAGAELVREALPALRQSQGTVVFINSGAGVFITPKNTLYGASKHALRILANGLRRDLEDDGVRVTSVFPGPVDTPMYGGDVDRLALIRPATVARAVIEAITASPDTQLTEIQVRPRRELT